MGGTSVNDMSIGQLNDFLTDKLSDIADEAHKNLLLLSNVVSTAATAETKDIGGATGANFNNMLDANGDIKNYNSLDASQKAAIDALAKEGGYLNAAGNPDGQQVIDAFNKFGMQGNIGGLTMGAPIKIQAIQAEIQNVVDVATSSSKAKEQMLKKIGQMLSQT